MNDLNVTWNSTKSINLRNGEIKTVWTSELDMLDGYTSAILNKDCSFIPHITQSIIKINEHLNKLATLDFYAIQHFIPSDVFKTDLQQMLKKYKGLYITPFTFLEWYTIGLWNYLNPSYHFDGQIIYLQFGIPLYLDRLETLFQVNPKPIIFNNNAYIFKTDTKYAILGRSEIIHFTETLYSEYCFSSFRAIFCKQIKKRSGECDILYIDKNIDQFHTECFTELPNNNMITQVGRDLYFTIFSPVNLIVTFHTLQYGLRVLESSKLIHQIDYKINASFFYFDSKNEPKYEIFIEKKNEDEYIFYTFKFPSKDYVIIVEIFILLIIFKLIDIIYFLRFKKKIYVQGTEVSST